MGNLHLYAHSRLQEPTDTPCAPVTGCLHTGQILLADSVYVWVEEAVVMSYHYVGTREANFFYSTLYLPFHSQVSR